jgi:DNA-binding NarL/FixJ family response regulator
VTKIRVFHCDDSPAFTRLVGHWLEEHPGLEHAGAAHSGPEAVEALPAARPDVVLLDTMGNPGDGALLAEIRRAAPQARVIVYSGYLSLIGRELLENGADAYVEKADDEAALVAAIHEVTAQPLRPASTG